MRLPRALPLPRLALSLALSVLVARPAAAQQPPPATASHRAAVQRLMEVSRVRELTEKTTDMMLDAQLKQAPQLGPFVGVMRDFYREQMSWAVLEPEFMSAYLEVFTEGEVREMTAFYETPIGQKMLAKMPVLMAKTNELTSRRVQTAMPALMQRLQAAIQQGGARPDTTRR